MTPHTNVLCGNDNLIEELLNVSYLTLI